MQVSNGRQSYRGLGQDARVLIIIVLVVRIILTVLTSLPTKKLPGWK